MPEPAELAAARRLAAQLSVSLPRAQAFQDLDQPTRAGLIRDLGVIREALTGSPASTDPYAFSMAAPARRDSTDGVTSPDGAGSSDGTPKTTKPPATETLAARTGALIDE